MYRDVVIRMTMKFGKAYNGKVKRRTKFPLNAIVIIFIISIVVFINAVFFTCIRPAIVGVMENRLNTIAVCEINKSVSEILKDVSYDDIMYTKYTDSGYVTSISLNAVDVNRVKSKLVLDINKRIEAISKDKVNIPLGSLLGNEFLSGLGPDIPAYIAPYGFVNIEFKDEFVSVGINQVKHVLYLSVRADMSMIMTGINCKKTVSTDVLVAQTVISGQVPEFYGSTGIEPYDVQFSNE